jgi:hypothetical protein
MGTTRLQSVPFAYYANGVNADNVDGVLSASKGGTGVASIAALKTALAIDQVNNTSDLAKPISTATQAALDTKVSTSTFSTTLAAKAPIDSPTFTGTVAGITKAMVGLGSVENTSDLAKPISALTQEALDTKVTITTFSSTIATKANTSDLALKAPIDSPTFTGTISGITKVMVGLGSVDNTADLAKPISTATQEALDTKVSASTYSTTLSTKVDTETFSTTVASKENTSNKSTATDLGGSSTSDILFPTQKAVKTYVDGQVNAGGVADGGITTNKLAAGAVTDEKVASGINKVKVGLGDVENTALSTWTGSTNIVNVGTITSGTWSGTAIDYSKLNLAQSITNTDVADGAIGWRQLNISKGDLTGLGLAGDEEIVVYQAGLGLIETTTTIPNGRRSGAPLITTTFDLTPIATNHILDDAITNDKIAAGVSKTKVGLGNVENTALSTWTGTSNISSLGTINSGTWSGTTIAINKGGTGATSAVDARANLGLIIGTNVQAPISAGLDYLAPNGSAANLTSFPTLNQNTTGNAATATLAGNISATSNSTLTSLANLTTIGTISSGIWSGTTIALNNGGTGATNAADARANLGLIIGTNVQAPLISGIDYLTPNGNAATATKLAAPININGIAFDGSSNIAIGVDASTISGTISVAKGGTGSTSLLSNSVLLGNGTNPLQVVSPGTSGNVLTSNGTTWTSAPITGVTAGNLSGTTLAANVINTSIISVGVLTNTTVNGKMTVGNSSESSSSAILEANSTSKGFLPPKMSASQRDAISNPASGLMIWCNNCGRTGEIQIFSEDEQWLTITGQTPSGVYSPSVGDVYQGGIVAYLLTPSDFGYDANIPHGLIVARSDINNGVGVPFTNININIPAVSGQNLENIGYGYSNTKNIINAYGKNTTPYAAELAISYRGGGYNDWYLPSKNELEKIYLARNIVGGFRAGTMGEGDAYWTSSLRGRNATIDIFYSITFASNRSYLYDYSIAAELKIRPVRSF